MADRGSAVLPPRAAPRSVCLIPGDNPKTQEKTRARRGGGFPDRPMPTLLEILEFLQRGKRRFPRTGNVCAEDQPLSERVEPLDPKERRVRNQQPNAGPREKSKDAEDELIRKYGREAFDGTPDRFPSEPGGPRAVPSASSWVVGVRVGKVANTSRPSEGHRLRLRHAKALRRRKKVFSDGRQPPIDRNDRARVMALAHAARRKREITHSAVGILWALLHKFANLKDGRCFPSYVRIAEAAGCHESTVGRCLPALEELRLLTWANRIKRVRERVPGLPGIWASVWRVVRTSNCYDFPLIAKKTAAFPHKPQSEAGTPLLFEEEGRRIVFDADSGLFFS
jgi:hypothetical protein